MHFVYCAHVVRIVDGDTVDLDVDLGFCIHHRMRVRLYGINAPEMNTEAGKVAKKALQSRIPFTQIEIVSHKDKMDKYGRYLVELIVNGENLNDWMVSSGNAVEYMK